MMPIRALRMRNAAAAGPTDPHFSNVIWLTGFNGTDGQNTGIVDEGPLGFSITAQGDAQYDTSQAKFGVSSGLFDGTGDAFFATDTGDRFELGTGLFTIEAWYRPNTLTGNHYLVCKGSTGTLSYGLRSNGTALEWVISTSGVTFTADITAAAALTASVWQHCCVDFDGTKYRLYVGGVMVGSSTTLRSLANTNANLVVGALGTFSSSVDGWIDEVRITKGVARYASDSGFVVPTAAFPRS